MMHMIIIQRKTIAVCIKNTLFIITHYMLGIDWKRKEEQRPKKLIWDIESIKVIWYKEQKNRNISHKPLSLSHDDREHREETTTSVLNSALYTESSTHRKKNLVYSTWRTRTGATRPQRTIKL